MNIEREKIINAYKLFTKFIGKLDEEQLSKWLDGEMKLTLQDKVTRKKVNKEDSEALASYKNQLEHMKSCEEASEYLNQLALNRQQLKDLASELGVYIKSRDNKDVRIQKIVEETIGTKLKMKILGKEDI